MRHHKIINIILVLTFSLSFTFVMDDAHAFVDCCATNCSHSHFQDPKHHFSAVSNAMNCSAGLKDTSCGFEACLDIDSPEIMISTAGMRAPTFFQMEFFSKNDAAGYALNWRFGQRRFSSTSTISIPLYLQTLSLLC